MIASKPELSSLLEAQQAGLGEDPTLALASAANVAGIVAGTVIGFIVTFAGVVVASVILYRRRAVRERAATVNAYAAN